MSNLWLYVVTVLIWGSTWLAIDFQLGTVAPEVSIAYRYFIAAGLLFAWCALRRLPLRFEPRDHGTFALLGLLLFCLNYLAAYFAQLYITSALNAVVFSTMLWLNILGARLLFGVAFEPRVLLGAVLGLAGIVTLFWPQIGELTLSDATVVGASLSFGGAVIASLGNMASQRAQGRALPVVQSNAFGMLYGALFTAALAVVRGQPFNFDPSPGYVTSLLYLAVFGSVLGFGSYLTLLGRIGAHKSGYVVVMFPVVAVILSILFEDLVISASVVAGIALVLAGNIVILSRRPRRAAAGA